MGQEFGHSGDESSLLHFVWDFQVGFWVYMSGVQLGLRWPMNGPKTYTWSLSALGFLQHGEKGIPKRDSLESELCKRTK